MKKAVLTTLQVVVTIGILCWVFRDWKQDLTMWNRLRHASLAWILTGILAYGVVEVLAGARWQILLCVQGLRLQPWRIGALLMIGIFFNMFMPGGTGGDIIKTFYLLKEIPDKKGPGLLAVLMDRMIGLMALIVLAGTIICLRYGWLAQVSVTRRLTWVLLAILLGSLAGIVFSFCISGFGLAHKLPQRMPMRDILIDLSVAYNAYARSWPASLAAFVCSLGVHVASFSMYYCGARAINVNLPILDFFAVMPIILTISAMPISVGGAGVSEALFSTMLVPLFGVGKASAIGVSLTARVIIYVWGLIGGLIYLFYRPTEHAKLGEIEREIHRLEHEIAESE